MNQQHKQEALLAAQREKELLAQKQAAQEKEEPPQNSDFRQLIGEICGKKVCEEQKKNMEDTMLELLDDCLKKELYCMHNDVEDLIEIAEADFDHEEEIRLVENFLYDNSSPRPPEELNVEIAVTILESLSPSPILIEDSDSHTEDIHILKELLSNDPLPLPENESSNFDHHADSSFPRPPTEPPDVEVFFDFEPDTSVLTTKVVKGISKHYVLMPNILPTLSTLDSDLDFTRSHDSLESRNKIFDPGIFSEVQSERHLSWEEFSISFIRDPLYPVFDTLIPFSSENEDKVFKPGELIGCGAFGHVYMGMNLDTGELLAVKQVSIAAANTASKEKAQVHIRELEEEVKLLKNLSHSNIVRYLGTVREEETLNILLEFVPGGSISSLLGKFGPFPEAVIRMYTKQILLGLDYLHKNGIMHRDIKGANILVDNKGCIKLADFGASKQVVELANGSGAKSMKGTPYWMAPEVILQTGHSFSADIWSVGCTVIEMATGKPPWSQQYQEVAALFYIGTTKSHPPIPDHLSPEAHDLLLKCLHKEPELRPSASDLLQHPFVIGKLQQDSLSGTHSRENIEAPSSSCTRNLDQSPGSLDVCNLGTLNFSTVNSAELKVRKLEWRAENSDNDMCQLDGDDFVEGGVKLRSASTLDDLTKSFNPMEAPSMDETYGLQRRGVLDGEEPSDKSGANMIESPSDSFQFVPSLSGDDDELTESKIRAFLDDKSPNRFPLGTPFKAADAVSNGSPGSGSRRTSNVSGDENMHSPMDLSSPQFNDMNGAESQQEASSPGMDFSEVQRKWKEELDQELERKREMMRQVGVGGKTSSPIDRGSNRQRERSRFASPGK
uniref:mitogen-activated protein kinase kinase kinase n=1 Tax=Tanacetum cinerariifolium TaxID=118510 RepID=A0A6L2KQK6_TANCI|nr:mitogen-activated protein kinase kinase kinase NPK1-like [Tanacetum cinerariifolium]